MGLYEHLLGSVNVKPNGPRVHTLTRLCQCKVQCALPWAHINSHKYQGNRAHYPIFLSHRVLCIQGFRIRSFQVFSDLRVLTTEQKSNLSLFFSLNGSFTSPICCICSISRCKFFFFVFLFFVCVWSLRKLRKIKQKI